ncbi:MAG TPA: UDP-N-acetylglucosamine pyrophosphorylase [Candidatus Omnitrophica bacterium]|nr:UDP-N-acetylglucosamine pyrophosphorylase [Candidatus Omnitrophota bacterium]
MSNFCIVILAAGEGKRMKSGLPKVMHRINSKPMVNYVVDAARKLGPKRIIAVLARKRLQVRDILDKDIKVAIQERQLGTADAVKAALKNIPSNVRDVVVLYGDTPLITEKTVRGLYDFHVAAFASCTVLTTILPNPRGYGRILRNESGQLIGIIEDKDANFQQKANKEINTGLYCFKREDLLEALGHIKPLNNSGELYLTDAFSWLFNRNKKIVACVTDDYHEVLGVNSQSELMEASEIIRRRILLKHLENGVLVDDFSTVFIAESAIIGAGTRIFPFAYIEDDVAIGSNCKVGPFVRLRCGAVLKDNVRVGNFAEIKNSTFGQGSSMGHLGYIGDTSVGMGVNIGAGVVVANFDGKKKNRTVIGDKAFVGCDSVLVAPVVIGRRAVVGAGSVVTRGHDVADGATVAGVPAKPINKKKKNR